MEVSHVIYFLLILGSFTFGFEALLLGLGGQLIVLYREDRSRTLKLALSLGLAISCLSIGISSLLNLQPIHLCASVLACTLLLSSIVRCYKKSVKTPLPVFPPIDDEEIKKVLGKHSLLESKEGKTDSKS
ncbi:MAG: hypothetical protein NZ934_04930 [Hadesarchaea archaeon]|nr:hypothetical protein [Hadesarchaea archaeon]